MKANPGRWAVDQEFARDDDLEFAKVEVINHAARQHVSVLA